MYTADPKQVGKLAEPVILMNTETGMCHSVETIEILDRCLNESMKLVDRKSGRSRLMQIYRDATPAEIEAWEKLGRKKRGEREKTVAESRIRNAPAVVVVGGDSPAAAAAQAAQIAALTSDDGGAALKAAEEAKAVAEKLAEEAKADREAAAKERADASEAIAAAQKAVADMQEAVAKMQAEAEAKAKADAETAAASAKAPAGNTEKPKTGKPAPQTSKG